MGGRRGKTFTTKEFDLLTFLAQNPNHVFTKEELFSKIWDMESIGDIATVTVHIKKIREKLNLIQPSLSTLRPSGELGIGLRYRENPPLVRGIFICRKEWHISLLIVTIKY